MKYKWMCKCGAMGREFLPRHKAVRGARGHVKRTGEILDIILVRIDGISQECKDESSRDI